MAELEEALAIREEQATRSRRTIVPGLVGNVTREELAERDADFTLGIADLVAGEADPGTQTPDAPVMSLAGAGMYILLPTATGDEALGVVSDRALDDWRADRFPGVAPTFERFKDDSDLLVLPFAITAPIGAPETWDGIVMGGPLGPSVELPPDGSVTITKQGAPVATITMDTAGSVTIEVLPGQSVNLGGPAAVELAKNDLLVTAMDAFIAALVAAGSGPTYAGAAAAQGVWNGLKSTFKTTKAKGE